MILTNIIETIGEDVELITRSDGWLDREYQSCADKMDELAQYMRALQLAKQIKIILSHKNAVPLRQIIRDNQGNPAKIILRLMSLPDAILTIEKPQTEEDELNIASQVLTWQRDGYDLDTSAKLGRSTNPNLNQKLI